MLWSIMVFPVPNSLRLEAYHRKRVNVPYWIALFGRWSRDSNFKRVVSSAWFGLNPITHQSLFPHPVSPQGQVKLNHFGSKPRGRSIMVLTTFFANPCPSSPLNETLKGLADRLNNWNRNVFGNLFHNKRKLLGELKESVRDLMNEGPSIS